MSDDLEIIDPTELSQEGLSWYDELPHSLRRRIIAFVGRDNDEQEHLQAFIAMAPDAIIRELYVRMMSVAEAAETLAWQSRLQTFIETGPPQYRSHREGRTPLQFLEDVWGEFMDHGVLYQDVLSAYDEKLIPAIYNHWNSHQRTGGERLPLPKRERTEAILRRIVAHGPDSLDDVMRAVRAYARRGEREK
jgi:hypothetical protein